MSTARKINAFVALAARIYLGAVFLLACGHKIADPTTFAMDVAAYRFLPNDVINVFAIVLPWVELVAGVLLIVGYRTRASALVISAMMVAFLIALGWALYLGLDMSCGCFAEGVGEADPIGWQTLVRDGIWLVIALYVLIWDRYPIGLDALLERRAAKAG